MKIGRLIWFDYNKRRDKKASIRSQIGLNFSNKRGALKEQTRNWNEFIRQGRRHLRLVEDTTRIRVFKGSELKWQILSSQFFTFHLVNTWQELSLFSCTLFNYCSRFIVL